MAQAPSQSLLRGSSPEDLLREISLALAPMLEIPPRYGALSVEIEFHDGQVSGISANRREKRKLAQQAKNSERRDDARN